MRYTSLHTNAVFFYFRNLNFKFKMAKQSKSIFLLLGLLLITMASCQDKTSALIRTWKLQDLRYTKTIPASLQPTIQKSIDDLKKSFIISYSPDGTYMTQMNNQTLHGTWKLNYNSSKISVVTDNGQAKEYTIVELTPESYKFKAEEGGQEVVFVMVPAN